MDNAVHLGVSILHEQLKPQKYTAFAPFNARMLSKTSIKLLLRHNTCATAVSGNGGINRQ